MVSLVSLAVSASAQASCLHYLPLPVTADVHLHTRYFLGPLFLYVKLLEQLQGQAGDSHTRVPADLGLFGCENVPFQQNYSV